MGLKLSTVLIGILLITLCVSGVYSIVNDLSSDQGYGVTLSENHEAQFQFTDGIRNATDDFSGTISNMTVDKTAFLALIPNTVSLLKEAFLFPYNVVDALIGTVTEILGLPDWLTTFFSVAILIALIFTFLSAVLRWQT